MFFGLVATAGTTFAAIEGVTALSVVMGCGAGALACALLVVNNLRDIPTDREVGKKTLAVRLGDRRTRWFYVVLLDGGVHRGHRGRVLARAGAARTRLPPRSPSSRAGPCCAARPGRDLIGVLGAHRSPAAGLRPPRLDRPAPRLLTCSQFGDDVGGGVRGVRGGRCGRRRRSARSGRRESCRARRRPISLNFASSVPARISVGTWRVARRSHSGSCVPVPVERRLEARPAAVLRRRSARRSVAGVNPANSGLASHSSMNASTPTVSMCVASASSDAVGRAARRRHRSRRSPR